MAGPKRTRQEIAQARWKVHSDLLSISLSKEMKCQIQQRAFNQNISCSRLIRDLFVEKYGEEKE